MKSEIVKVKRGPIGPNELTFEESIAALSAAGWTIQQIGEELHCHGLASNDFTHTYKVTLLLTKPDETT